MSKDQLEVISAQQATRIELINGYHAQAMQTAEDHKAASILCAFELTVLKRITPHGQFTTLRERYCPKLSERQSQYYISGFRRIAAKSALSADLLERAEKAQVSPLGGDQKPKLLSEVNKVLDGASFTDFSRATGALREPEKAGGFRPDAKAVQAWLKENHPELVGTKFNDLPEPIQKAFKKQYKPVLDPKLLAQSKRDRAKALLEDLALALDEQDYKKFWDDHLRKCARELFHDFHSALIKLEQKKPGAVPRRTKSTRKPSS